MKLHFNLANGAQMAAVGPVGAEEFLHLEGCSKMAFGAAMAQSVDLLGPDSPVWQHIESLCRDFGRFPEQEPEQFEVLLKAYWGKLFPVYDKPAAQLVWQEIDRRFTDHTGDKAFRRLFERCACEHYGIKSIDQDICDEFQALLKTEPTEWV